MIKNPRRVDTEEYLEILMYFYKVYTFMTLTIDVMFVKRTEFLIISARKLKFVTVEHIPSQM